MLERIESKEKRKCQFILSENIAHYIRIRAAELGKTQSRYLEDLVMAERALLRGIGGENE